MKNDCIYSGTAGIVYALVELYFATGIKAFRYYYIEGIKWLENYYLTHNVSNFSLYTGKMGFVFLLLKISEKENKAIMTQKALNYAEGCLKYLETNPKCELLDGAAGTMLTLLHLYDKTGSIKVLEYLETYANYILGKTRWTEEGAYWDPNIDQIKPLCGFSHGASGIGFAFLELSNYLGKKNYLHLIQNAFNYENKFYDKTKNNWQDNRKFNDTKDTEEAFRVALENKDWTAFYNTSDLNAWCHGAAGIGLSRLRAYELYKNNNTKHDLEKAIKKTRITEIIESVTKHTLCHGITGNALLFHQAFLFTSDKKYENYYLKTIEKLLKQKELLNQSYFFRPFSGTDSSLELFLGKSGVSLFLISSMTKNPSMSIYYPIIRSKNIKNATTLMKKFGCTEVEAKLMPFKNEFPLTFHLLKQMKIPDKILMKKLPKFSKTFFSEIPSVICKVFGPRIKTFPFIFEILEFEYYKWKLHNDIPNYALHNYIRKSTLEKSRKAFEARSFNNMQFRLADYIIVKKVEWDWIKYPAHKILDNTTHTDTFLLLIIDPRRIEILRLNQFSFILMDALTKRVKTLSGIIRAFIRATGLAYSQELENKIKLQLKEYCLSGFIEVC